MSPEELHRVLQQEAERLTILRKCSDELKELVEKARRGECSERDAAKAAIAVMEEMTRKLA